MSVRRTATWMQQLDDRILEWLDDDQEGWATPHLPALDARLPCTFENRIRERCHALQYAGLVAPLGTDCYELTSWGQLYLRGEIDAAHQPRPTVRALRG